MFNNIDAYSFEKFKNLPNSLEKIIINTIYYDANEDDELRYEQIDI